MFYNTRNQIVLILGVFCISIITGFVLMKISNRDKMDMFISEMQSDKAVLLDRIIDFKSKSLLDYTTDYTYWDEMVSFVINNDQKWATDNIESSISTYGVDYTWVYRPDLSIVYSVARDSMMPFEMPFDEGPLSKIVQTGKFQHFFISTQIGVVEISGASIHPSFDRERKTPVQGYFFAGRLWTNSYLNEIGLLTGSRIKLTDWGTLNSHSTEKPNEKYVFNNFKTLNGWDNLPVVQITSTSNVKIIELLSSRIEHRFLYGTVFAFLFVIVFLMFFWIRVYRPLNLLSQSLKNGNTNFIKEMLSHKNEFGQFAGLINQFFQQKNELLEEISERKTVERQLRKLSAATEQSPAIIIITGVDGNIEYVNSKFTEITGYTSEEAMGRNPRFLKSGDKTESTYSLLTDTISSGQVWHGEFKNKRKTGEIFYESVVISPITDETGKITHFISVQEDITNERRMESVRNVLLEISRAGAISKNLGDLIDEIKIRLSELIDVTNFYLAIYNEQSDSFTLPHFQDQKDGISTFKAAKTLTAYVLRTKKTFFATDKDIEQLKLAGLVESIGEPAKIWLGVPLIADDKAFGVFVVQSYDNENAFSENDKEMMEFISNEISHTILRKKADEEIRVALEKAEGSDRLKSTFLANMSHEIRTPLNSILGFSELLIDPEIDPENQFEFTQIIKSSGKQLLGIINDILDFSMIEAGQIRLVKTTFPVEKVILEISSEYFSLAAMKGIEFKVAPTISKTETFIETDLARLRQALSNLVNNALKFTRSGAIEIGFSIGNKGLMFYVKDTGIGISPEFKDHVFERFQQIEKTKSRNYGGNGLGLAISKSLVEMMGGKIWFESKVGVGSTFYIFLPH